MKKINFQPSRSSFMGLALATMATVFGVSSCTTDFDLDTRTPEWLGTSIFETLDKGFEGDSGKVYHFKTYVRLIKDLEQDNILAKTGSKTLFVADDDAFDRFFANCPFVNGQGEKVKSYEELSYAQKTLILNGSMLNNVYQVAMLSSLEGPVLGDCMRRVSSATIYDSIPIMKPDEMPKTQWWERHINNTARPDGIAIMKDGTVKPMIFFVNKFLTTKRITDDDYNFLFNIGSKFNKPGRQPGEATVNGIRIAYQNKKCFNGFIHVMDEVLYLLPNMAEYLEMDNGKSIIYGHILDRFSAPFPDVSLTAKVQELAGQGKLSIPASALDTIFVKKFYSKFSNKGGTGGVQNTIPGQSSNDNISTLGSDKLLKFDPGWNLFYSDPDASDATLEVQRNMGVMMVPTDKAMKAWWMNSAMRDRYGTLTDGEINGGTLEESYQKVAEDMDGIPVNVIVELLNNNMLTSLVASVPSKFGNVLNDANDPMFEDTQEAVATIDSVVICCNGAIYFTNTVYAPTSYRSVAYPALVNEDLQVINWAIQDKELGFKAYLNSMSTEYTLFLPVVSKSTDPKLLGKLMWIDPVSYAQNKWGSTENMLSVMVFSYNGQTVDAYSYPYDITTNTVMPAGTETEIKTAEEGGIIRDRLMDLMDYHIIIGNVEGEEFSSVASDDRYVYCQTKGRGTVRYRYAATQEPDVDAPGTMMPKLDEIEVAGGYQLESADPAEITVTKRYDQFKAKGNGIVYLIDKPLQTSRRSVYDVVSDAVNYPEFQNFFSLMTDAGIFAESSNKHAIGSTKCISSFNTYHYSVYVPGNEAIQDLLDRHVIFNESYVSKMVARCQNFTDQIDEEEDDEMVAAKRLLDSTIVVSREIRLAAAGSANTAEDSTFNYVTWATNSRKQLKNFVNYHIQDNSVYVNGVFNAGYDEQNRPAEKANYETAYMNAKNQFVKLAVAGGKQIVLTDANSNTVNVLTDNPKYYNIMCREYEFDTGDSSSPTKVLKVESASIETSSFAVVHLIDKALCNGEVIF